MKNRELTDKQIGELTEELRKEMEKPGANRDSLTRFLVKEKKLAPPDAEALAAAVCKKLLGERFPPITEMELMLTEDCNQRCDYCFVEGKNALNDMPWEVARKAVDFLLVQSRERKEIKLLFFGGEPLLRFDLIEKITLYAEAEAKKSGKTVNFDMTTNGTLLDEEKASFLGKHGIKYLLSIDGDRETHDRHRKSLDGTSSYRRIMKNLPFMKRNQPWMGARITIHPDTVGAFSRNVRHLAELGINQFIGGPATGQDWTDQELDIYKDQMIEVTRWLKEQLEARRPVRITSLEEDLKDMGGRRNLWGCRAGRQSITITARGEIFPCSKMLGVEGLQGICRLGTLDEGMTEIYNRLSICGMIPTRRERCSACDEIDRCMGGCFATNYQATGSLFEPDPLECRLKKKTIEIVREAEEILGQEYFEKYRNIRRGREGDARS